MRCTAKQGQRGTRALGELHATSNGRRLCTDTYTCIILNILQLYRITIELINSKRLRVKSNEQASTGCCLQQIDEVQSASLPR